MADVVEFTIPGPPPKKNERHEYRVVQKRNVYGVRRPERRGFIAQPYDSLKFETFCLRTCLVLGGRGRIVAKQFELLAPPTITIGDGHWTVSVDAYWPQMSRVYDVPRGDWDAPISAVCDAFERAGGIDNDARIINGTATKHYDKANPRTEIRLERIK